MDTWGTGDATQDEWTYIWGTTEYTPKQAYKQLCWTPPASPSSNGCWNHLCSPSRNFFFWLLLRDRLNTQNMLGRKNKHLPFYHCVPCVQQEEETLLHLFFDCPFTQTLWIYLGVQWDLSQPPLDIILTARAHFGSSIFSEVIIVAAWCIWCHRNM